MLLSVLVLTGSSSTRQLLFHALQIRKRKTQSQSTVVVSSSSIRRRHDWIDYAALGTEHVGGILDHKHFQLTRNAERRQEEIAGDAGPGFFGASQRDLYAGSNLDHAWRRSCCSVA